MGHRLAKEYWGQGIAAETLRIMLKYLLEETDINIITASTMIENHVSAQVLKMNGFPGKWCSSCPYGVSEWNRIMKRRNGKCRASF